MLCSALKKASVAVALIGMVGAASAATHNLGTLTNTTPISFSMSGLSGSYDETLSFTFGMIPADSFKASFAATGLFGDIGLDPIYSQTFGGYTTPSQHLFSFTNPTTGAVTHTGYLNYDQVKHTFAMSDAVPLSWFPGSTLNLNIKGTLGTSQNAAFNLTLAPVPEPESYALMLAGLSLMGAIARRRNKKVNG